MLEKTGTLKIASVGDCGLRVLRNGDSVGSLSSTLCFQYDTVKSMDFIYQV